MTYFLIAVLVILCIMVVVSLVRGIVAFLQSTKMDLENDADEGRATEMQLKQNSAMFARIKYQALAIVVVAVILAIAQ
ncbi:HIG1 domain-containing protein [Qipengyuania atrilutea]|uniref:HIG1 domain-containing protein n=1 Tax=Qipengyuania atrilutea TaxID=2744473 RepID=A0A850GYH4_9SPHN|nr:HIG1 domain-containing protein [Actirhodobacter atriluteus]NVD44684.1 HIG1 domain-containing protein [Actirhodobacter atriluteus]